MDKDIIDPQYPVVLPYSLQFGECRDTLSFCDHFFQPFFKNMGGTGGSRCRIPDGKLENSGKFPFSSQESSVAAVADNHFKIFVIFNETETGQEGADIVKIFTGKFDFHCNFPFPERA
jgi:hypothetical protein